MRILLATDGSTCSEAAVNELCCRPWPPDSEVKVLSVVHPRFPLLTDPFLIGVAEPEHFRSGLHSDHIALFLVRESPDALLLFPTTRADFPDPGFLLFLSDQVFGSTTLKNRPAHQT